MVVGLGRDEEQWEDIYLLGSADPVGLSQCDTTQSVVDDE